MKKIFLTLSILICTVCAVHAQNNVIGTAGNVLVGSTTDNGTGAVLQVTGTTSITNNLNLGGQFNGFKFGVTSGSSYYIGNMNALPNSTSYQNVAIGNTGNTLTSGFANFLAGATWVGGSVTTGSGNTAIAGYGALAGTTTGSYNTALGNQTLFDNQTGGYNTAIGSYAGTNVTGSYNTMIGGYAGVGVTGSRNTIIGSSWPNASGITIGDYNTIIGNVTGLTPSLSSNIILADGQGNQRININSDGYVGIGVTNPSAKLQVYGSSGAGTMAYIGNGNNGSSTADASLLLSSAGANGGSPLVHFDVSSVRGAIMGLDNGDDSKFKISAAAGFRNGDYLTILTGTNAGNVGIGTATPATKLDVVGGTVQVTNSNPTYALIDNSNSNYSWSVQNTAGAYRFYDNTTNAERMRIGSNGYVGIGTTNPGAKLDVNGNIRLSQSSSLFFDNMNGSFISQTAGGALDIDASLAVGNGNITLSPASSKGLYLNYIGGSNVFFCNGSSTPISVVNSNGSMGIATLTVPSGYKLAVAGNAIAESMTVKLQADWPDYVFKIGHNLMPLADVKTYIDKNQHLPEIPSAAEVAKDGQNLGEMNKLLLKKVEELTLYLIDKDKQLQSQEERLKAVEQQLLALKNNK